MSLTNYLRFVAGKGVIRQVITKKNKLRVK
jgi:hypothetical protein